MIQRMTDARGYGGDVLKFHESRDYIMAVHRVWTLSPRERRLERLTRGSVEERRTITNGCINVTPEVYQKLVDCCANTKLVVR